MVTRICFVCLGNIVRSPLAENLFRYHAERAGAADRYVVDSAGTSPVTWMNSISLWLWIWRTLMTCIEWHAQLINRTRYN
jgi:predicted protein tyrosine phosphatase